VEAPFLGKTVVNIGNRQKGRYISGNVINSDNSAASISDAIMNASENRSSVDYYFGDGNSSGKIVKLIGEFLVK
jgi:UDP-N-acetylglucosamine 2-epimerase